MALTVLSPCAAQTAPNGSGYVNAAACAECHAKIAETYARTGMARSFGGVTSGASVPPIPEQIFQHAASGEFFSIAIRNARPVLQRWQTGFDGSQANRFEASVDYRFGSGNHAISYLHRSAAGDLVELPLSWYAENGGRWAMSPGYDRADHFGFSRKITYRCMFCHNAYPAIEPGRDTMESGTRFPADLPEGIDCQRCHGPGLKHIQAAKRGDSAGLVRAAIVNPARLAPTRRMEVCLQCHLETTSLNLPAELMRAGRTVYSYRPGEPLGDYALYFDHAPGGGYDDKLELDGSAYRLRRSACFLASRGALTCTTCHDVHDIPREPGAAAHYAQICKSCHAATIAKLSSQNLHPASPDCVACHMPKRRAADAIHIAITDHYIRRRPEAAAETAVERTDGNTPPYRGEVLAYYPPQPYSVPADALYLAVAQVQFRANPAEGLRRLESAIAKYRPPQGEFYFHLGNAYRDAGQLSKAVAAYREAESRTPSWKYAYGLGMEISAAGHDSAALEPLTRARALALAETAVMEALSAVYARMGKPGEAVAALEAALAADPDSAGVRNNLGVMYMQMGQAREAEAYLRESIRRQPETAPAHLNLAELLARSDRLSDPRLPEAQYHFEAAIRLDAGSAAAHAGYGALLVSTGAFAAGRAQFEESLRLDPDLQEARNNLGSVLLQLGDTAAAAAQFRLAIAAHPESAIAHYNLALALLRTGDAAEAEKSLRTAVGLAPGLLEGQLKLGQILIARRRADLAEPYLKRAAQSADPLVRKAAEEALHATR